MKRTLILLCLITFSMLQTFAQNKKEDKKVLRHVVLFSFKEGSTPDQIKNVTNAFAELPKKIKEIKAFEWGTNNSPENLSQGFTHCFYVSFASENGRAIYLPHPEHRSFVEILKPILDKVLVIDYWTE